MENIQCPIIFEQRYSDLPQPAPPQPPAEKADGLHVVILVHGFMGNAWENAPRDRKLVNEDNTSYKYNNNNKQFL
eukprot:1397862-Amphidinium_carterae.1